MTVRICHRARVPVALRHRNRGAGDRLAGRADIAALRFEYEGARAQQRETDVNSKHVRFKPLLLRGYSIPYFTMPDPVIKRGLNWSEFGVQ